MISGQTARAIAASVEGQIRDGELVPGTQLPTIRGLSTELGVSPMTVATAYGELRRRGLLTAAGRRGTSVSERPPLPVTIGPLVPEGSRDLATGNPDPELLPPLGPALAGLDRRPRAQPHSGKLERLVELAEGHFAADGIPTEALAIVGGALDGIERVLSAHLAPGDKVAVEDPVFIRILDLLRALGFVTVPVEVDDEGPRSEPLEAALAGGASAFIMTPRWQNPLGACLSPERADDLRGVLSAYEDVLVVEDDHCGLIALQPPHSFGRERTRWATVRSASKAFGADFRLAVMAGDPTTIARVEWRQLLGTGWVCHIVQELVAVLWGEPVVQEQLKQAANIYDARRLALLQALRDRGIGAHGASGLNVWIPVDEEATTVAALLHRGWAVAAGERWRLGSGRAIRITTSTLLPEEVEAVSDDLAEILSHRAGAYSG